MILCISLEGIDTWTRLHARMVVMLPKFNRSATACRKKHENLFKAYKEDKMANGISGNARHESKFFDAMDEWWHQTGQVMKDVSATTTSHEENQSNSTPDEVESLTTTIPTRHRFRNTPSEPDSFNEDSNDINLSLSCILPNAIFASLCSSSSALLA